MQQVILIAGRDVHQLALTDEQACIYDTVDGYSTYAPVSTAASILAEQNYPYVAAQFVSLRWLQ
jgi:hypothetical protein